MSDDAKRAVLARRARFVAAAMAGIATASCDACSRPCLSPRPTSVDASPGPCLSVPMGPVDAGEQIAIDSGADAGDAGDAGKDASRAADKRPVIGPPPPQPCLSPMPRVCLEPL